MEITTARLTLRHWKTGDRTEAESLYRYARDPDIGIRCGWMPHRNVEESMETIEHVFTGDENYAITLTGEDKPIGAFELKKTGTNDHATEFVTKAIAEDRLFEGADKAVLERALAHCEHDRVLGYWIGRPFWGQGLMTEALDAMLTRAFTELGANAVWGGHYAENPASGKVMAHCGMTPVCRQDHDYFHLIDRYFACIMTVITKDQWAQKH